jgi:hypothetical protein
MQSTTSHLFTLTGIIIFFSFPGRYFLFKFSKHTFVYICHFPCILHDFNISFFFSIPHDWCKLRRFIAIDVTGDSTKSCNTNILLVDNNTMVCTVLLVLKCRTTSDGTRGSTFLLYRSFSAPKDFCAGRLFGPNLAWEVLF